MLDRLTIERMLAWAGDRPVLVALSGGGDSVALLNLLVRGQGSGRVRAVNVDHALRPGSADDARAAKKIAESFAAPADILTLSWEEGANRAQQAAREARYRAICDHARALGSNTIVTAHTADDQAETVLMRAAMRVMYRINNSIGVPYMGGVHGKNDATLGWVEYYYWYDSLEVAHQGGLWFWDQRKHNGNNKNFTDTEAFIDYDRFFTNRSYPAFSYCSINQDRGAGIPSSGDPYGAFNGYLDWEDASILDTDSSYSIRCFIKDMTVGGTPMPSYNTCTTDLTLRRLQHFNPQIGQLIGYTVHNENGQLLNSGSFISDGLPATIHGITIERDGSTVEFQIQGPLKKDFTIVANSLSPSITI